MTQGAARAVGRRRGRSDQDRGDLDRPVWLAPSRVCLAAVLAGLRSQGRSLKPDPDQSRAGTARGYPCTAAARSRSPHHPRRSLGQRVSASAEHSPAFLEAEQQQHATRRRERCATTGAKCRRSERDAAIERDQPKRDRGRGGGER